MSDKKVRIQLDLVPSMTALLDALASASGSSRAGVIRKGIMLFHFLIHKAKANEDVTIAAEELQALLGVAPDAR